MLTIKNRVEASFFCEDCGQHYVITRDSLEEAVKVLRDRHWTFLQTSYPARKDKDISDILCEKCTHKNNEKLKHSKDLRQRIQGGYEFTEEEFKEQALAYVGLTNHPKADAIFAKAREDGHSSGNAEILNCLQELAELVK